MLVAAIDVTLDGASWDDGSKEHAVFSFSNAECNLALGGKGSLRCWIVFTAILTGGDEVTLAAGSFVLHEDNNAAADPPIENAGTAITLEQADGRYPRLGEEGSGDMTKAVYDPSGAEGDAFDMENMSPSAPLGS